MEVAHHVRFLHCMDDSPTCIIIQSPSGWNIQCFITGDKDG